MPSEAHVEAATMAWFAGLGYETAHDRDVGPDAEDKAKRLRDSYAEVILGRTLDSALASLNPQHARGVVCFVFGKLDDVAATEFRREIKAVHVDSGVSVHAEHGRTMSGVRRGSNR